MCSMSLQISHKCTLSHDLLQENAMNWILKRRTSSVSIRSRPMVSTEYIVISNMIVVVTFVIVIVTLPSNVRQFGFRDILQVG